MVKKGYQEIIANQIGELPDGSRIRITGILLNQSESMLVIGDKSGEFEAVYDAATDFENQQIVRVFGEAHSGRIIAEKVIPLDLDFDLFIKMQSMTRKISDQE